MLKSIQQYKFLFKKLSLLLVSALFAVVVSYGMLHVVYHPGLFYGHLVRMISTIRNLFPGFEIFALTYSPFSVLVVSAVFWSAVTQKHAWVRFRHFCVRMWRQFIGIISFTLAASSLVGVCFMMLYRSMQNGESISEIAWELLALQVSVYLFIRALRLVTIPWLAIRWERLNFKLDAVDELRKGQRVERNRKILHALDVQKEGEKVWQRSSQSSS